MNSFPMNNAGTTTPKRRRTTKNKETSINVNLTNFAMPGSSTANAMANPFQHYWPGSQPQFVPYGVGPLGGVPGMNMMPIMPQFYQPMLNPQLNQLEQQPSNLMLPTQPASKPRKQAQPKNALSNKKAGASKTTAKSEPKTKQKKIQPTPTNSGAPIAENPNLNLTEVAVGKTAKIARTKLNAAASNVGAGVSKTTAKTEIQKKTKLSKMQPVLPNSGAPVAVNPYLDLTEVVVGKTAKIAKTKLNAAASNVGAGVSKTTAKTGIQKNAKLNKMQPALPDSSSLEKIITVKKTTKMAKTNLNVTSTVTGDTHEKPKLTKKRETNPKIPKVSSETTKIANLEQPQNLGNINGVSCIICWDASPSIALAPCGHKCVCVNCSNSISHCPLCREEIISRMKIYDL